LDELVNKIKCDQAKRIVIEIDEPLSINIFNTSSSKDHSTMELNGQFVHSQLLIDVLIRMRVTSTDKNELICLCQKEYKNNKDQLTILREFEQDYRSDRALWWYTRQSFVYRLLNKALRVQNIDMLFLFRFLIRDIGEQLKQYQCSSPIHVYRGQRISNDELEVLKVSVGQYISMNSFLSTSLDRNLALSFLSNSASENDNLQNVLFEINADPQVIGVKPFANISSHSYFVEEQEVLIMLGAIFRLLKIYRIDNQIWIIEMNLCGDNDHNLKPIVEQLKKEYGEGDDETSLLSFGNVLFKMGKYDEAKMYLHRLLNQLPNDHQIRARCYFVLGNTDSKKDELDSSLAWHLKSLEIRKRTCRSDDPELANSYNSIAVVYRKKGEFNRATESFDKALSIFRRAYGDDHPEVATCLTGMGHVYQRTKRYSEALVCFQKALTMNEKHLPNDHSYLGIGHSNIANVYRSLKNYKLALEHATLGLKIIERSLPSQHYHIAWTLQIIGNICEDQNMLTDALSYYRKAASIYCNALPPTHYYIFEINQSVERVKAKIK
jgi:tetratricopeptide (TPR) repeat protein